MHNEAAVNLTSYMNIVKKRPEFFTEAHKLEKE